MSRCCRKTDTPDGTEERRNVPASTSNSPQAQLQLSSKEIISVVIDARSALPQATMTGLKKLSVADKKNLIDLYAAIVSSTDIIRAHIW